MSTKGERSACAGGAWPCEQCTTKQAAKTAGDNKTTSWETELEALSIVLVQFLSLDAEARARVMRYLLDRFYKAKP